MAKKWYQNLIFTTFWKVPKSVKKHVLGPQKCHFLVFLGVPKNDPKTPNNVPQNGVPKMAKKGAFPPLKGRDDPFLTLFLTPFWTPILPQNITNEYSYGVRRGSKKVAKNDHFLAKMSKNGQN